MSNVAATGIHVQWYPFAEHPRADSCWSVSAGPDGRIYAAACCEGLPGGTVKLMRFNENDDRLDCLFDLAEATDDPYDSGRATQCKIHYSFAPSAHDGIMYMATHLSGPPIDQPAYSPWHSWHDARRCFRGAALVAYDTREEAIRWWQTLFPREGCRCLLHDEARGLLYALSYPLDHLWVFDPASRTSRDLGRIGSINAQVLFTDRRHRVWTTSDYGRLMRYDPDSDRLEESPYVLPHDSRYQTGWHSVLYDAVADPAGDSIFAVTWIAHPRLMRIFPDEGPWGHVEDLGPATQERDTAVPMDTFTDHCGGLTFAADGGLYYVATRWRDPRERYRLLSEPRLTAADVGMHGVLWRMDPSSLERRELLCLERPGGISHYISRGAVDRNGELFFGIVNHYQKPNGVFRVRLPAAAAGGGAVPPLRMWG